MGNRIRIIKLIIMENYNLVMIEKSYAIANSMPETGTFMALSSHFADFYSLLIIRTAIPAYNSIIQTLFRTFLK